MSKVRICIMKHNVCGLKLSPRVPEWHLVLSLVSSYCSRTIINVDYEVYHEETHAYKTKYTLMRGDDRKKSVV